jgi:hypothetical protein
MRIGKLQISRIRAPEDRSVHLELSEEHFQELHSKGKRLLLGTLAARSGTRWLCDIVKNHDNSFAVTERDATVEAFWRYVKYNELPIETDGIIKLLRQRIASDWQKNDLTLIFSPYFSHGFLELYRALDPEKVIFGIAPPEFVVQSIYNKNLFVEDYLHRDADLALGYQTELADRWSHFFGRIVPRGSFYKTWEGLTRVGKIAWWVNRVNMDIYEQLRNIPPDRVIVFDLNRADQNYEYYLDLARSLSLSPMMSQERFLSLKKLTVKKSDNVKHAWSSQERTEFDFHISEWQQAYDEIASRSGAAPPQ